MNRNLIMIGLGLFIWGIGEGAFFIFNPLYMQELGANPVLIGTILGVGGLAMTVAHIPAGYISDRIGARPLIITASITGILATVLMGLVHSLPFFVAGLLLYNLTAFIIAPLNSYTTAVRGKLSVGRAFTLTSAMYNTGAIIGPLFGGWLGARYGLQTVYLTAIGFFVVSTTFMFLLRPQPIERHAEGATPPSLLANRRYFGLMAISFIAMFAMYLPQPLSQNFLHNLRGVSIDQIGSLGAVNSLGIVILNLALGHLEASTGFLLGQAAVAVFTFLLWQQTGLGWYFLAYALLGGFRVSRPLLAAQVRQFIHGSQMGLAYGLTETINALPNIIAPPLAGILYSYDPVMVYPLSLGLILFSLLIGITFLRRLSPASQVTPSPEVLTPLN